VAHEISRPCSFRALNLYLPRFDDLAATSAIRKNDRPENEKKQDELWDAHIEASLLQLTDQSDVQISPARRTHGPAFSRLQGVRQ
jgi:hypothetical protein